MNKRAPCLTRSGYRIPLPCFLLGVLFSGLTLQFASEPVAIAQAATCAGTQITGTAFRDYNANGAKESGEPGLAGIVVTAYAANGTATACETTINGTYAIDPTAAFPVRLEFTLPTDGHLNFLRPGVKGPDAETTVIFVNGPSSHVDVGFNNPAQYCGANSAPELAVACYVFGEQNNNPDGVNKNLDVLVSFPYHAGSTDVTNEAAVRSPTPTHRAFAKEIGSVWGLAWRAPTQTLYAAAFLKRHAGFGPYGPGAIYQVDASGASLFYNFGTLAGADPHPQPGTTCLSPGHNPLKTNGNCWLNDPNSFDQVGKVGFGDLEISEDSKTLYTINLATRALMAIPLNNPAAATSIPVPTPPSCPVADLRPFGIGVNDGVVYIGLVCSAESTKNINYLRGYVYAYADGAFKNTPMLDFPLTYDRGMGTAQWAYWLKRSSFTATDARQKAGKWAQPLLTDITFDHGDMILALRDRNGDQFGSIAGGPDPADTNNYSAISRGDILRACATPGGLPTSHWVLEQNGQCGNVTTAGAGNGEGPHGGEYYFRDQQFNPLHSETSLGSQFQVPGLSDVVSVIFNPVEGHSAVSDGGIKWYDNRTATTTRSYLIFDASSNPALFQKASGLGDLVALCPPTPIEIGNRVWLDSDQDGIQDPSEPGLDHVSIELYRKGILVGTTETANDGQYYFNDTNVKLNGANGIAAGTGTGGNSDYEIRLPNAERGNQQAALAGLTLTLTNHDLTANGDLRDSDGARQGANAFVIIPQADLLAPGDNNHTYDFGFIQPAPRTATPHRRSHPQPHLRQHLQQLYHRHRQLH